MSSLTSTEKRYLEEILNMGGGYVLDYSNPTFKSFFSSHQINIYDKKYEFYGPSKANRMRAFWRRKSDSCVGKVLSEMLDSYVASCDIGGQKIDTRNLEKSREIVARLLGKSVSKDETKDIDGFLAREFTLPNIDNLPIDSHIIPIIKSRINEAGIAFKHGAHLSVILLCGSTLEGILLGAASKNPVLFNQAKACPKDRDGKVKYFHEWTLSESINVACEVGLLKSDAKKFSHDLRDFRNYIHPYEQERHDFMPDKHNAEICLQVLKMALASVAGKR